MSHILASPSLGLVLIAGRAIALVLGLLIFAWAFRHWRRAASRDTQRVFEQLDLVRSELLIMKEAMHHSQRGLVNTANLNATAHMQTTPRDVRLPSPIASGAARGYEIAARMARNGANKEDLIRSCGITAHEADLLIKLHGHRRDNGSPFGADMIGRQVRTPESNAGASAKNSQTANPMSDMPRATHGSSANTSATRGRSENAKPAMQSRSRLVAVG